MIWDDNPIKVWVIHASKWEKKVVYRAFHGINSIRDIFLYFRGEYALKEYTEVKTVSIAPYVY